MDLFEIKDFCEFTFPQVVNGFKEGIIAGGGAAYLSSATAANIVAAAFFSAGWTAALAIITTAAFAAVEKFQLISGISDKKFLPVLHSCRAVALTITAIVGITAGCYSFFGAIGGFGGYMAFRYALLPYTVSPERAMFA